MKRLAFLLILLIVLLCPRILVAAEKEMTFRKTTWGMSFAEVRASESLKIFKQEKDLLIYKVIVGGKDMMLGYNFIDDQLVMGKYLLTEVHTNKNDYISDYKDFKKILTKKYGRPKTDEIFWRNELFKNSHSDWGRAVSVGHLIYLSTWETPSTKIGLALTGDNFKIECFIDYTGKKFVKLIEKIRDQEKSEPF